MGGGVGGLVISLVPSCKYIVGRKKNYIFKSIFQELS